MARYTPHVDVRMLSPNCSSRGGATPTLIVIHATVSHNRKGLADLKAIGAWFGTPRSQASSHVCTDNEGNSARYVRDADKAWHCAAFNRLSLGIEQILMADGTELTQDLYRETARWVARWSKQYGIPIRKGAVNGTTVVKTGVVRHSELGSAGGGHADPGSYDMHAMLQYARYYRARL
jgi:N-acetyl-anhydromuramyl-L-alanine amidase AmpD